MIGSMNSSNSRDNAASDSSTPTPLSSRRCHICKRTSPFDATSLIQCIACLRSYHKGCHTPAVSFYEPRWQCFYCAGKKHKRLASPMRPGSSSDRTFRSYSLPEEAVQPSTKRRMASGLRPFTNLIQKGQRQCSMLEGISGESLHAHAAFRHVPSTDKSHQVKDRHTEKLQQASGSIIDHIDNLSMNSHPVVSPRVSLSGSTSTIQVRKSTVSYRCLAAMPLVEAQGHKLSTREIVTWIAEHVNDYHMDSDSLESREWQEGVHHALLSHSHGSGPLFESHPSDDPEIPLWRLCTSHIVPDARPSTDTDIVTEVDSEDTDERRSNARDHISVPLISHIKHPTQAVYTVAQKIRDMKQPEFSALSIQEIDPVYSTYARSHSYLKTTADSDLRPSRKQVFGKQGISRLHGQDSSTRIGKMRLGLQRYRDRTSKQQQLEILPGPTLSEKVSKEEPECESFTSLEELLDLPEAVTPFVCDNQLAFRDASLSHESGRQRRPKVVYKNSFSART